MQVLNQQLIEALLDIAHQAGAHLKKFYASSVTVETKADNTPVTQADLFMSQFIIEQLTRLTPNIPVLSEENCAVPLVERAQWQEYWLIDPLDGTQQFIDRTDQFSIVIGLMQHNRPVLGVIHAPILEKTYYAMTGYGAFLIEKNKTQPLIKRPVSPTFCKSSLKKHRLLVTIGTSNRQKVVEKINSAYLIDFLQYGSSSLKAGLVAEGKADCYVRFGDTGEWDTAVAEILLQEVGGEIFDIHFQPLSYNQRDTFVNPHFVMINNTHYPWREIFLFDK